jgi:hypothetical protein
MNEITRIISLLGSGKIRVIVTGRIHPFQRRVGQQDERHAG